MLYYTCFNKNYLKLLNITTMKKQILILMMSLFALTVMAEKTKKEVTFNVPLDCENCVKKVEKNIAFEKGVKDISCDLVGKTVTVTYLAEKTNIDKLKKGFAKIGYKHVTVVGDACCDDHKCEGDYCGKTKKTEGASDTKKECKGECSGSCGDKHQEGGKSTCCKE